jgi:pilus assembly protein CpaF
MMPPISTHGISLVIQPPRPQQVDLAQLLDTDLFDDKMREFLELCIQQRRNILLAGDPGSGRTTLLGALASMIPQDERVVSVERVRELELAHPHWVALETRAPDAHGNGGVSLQSLIEHSLRIRPQRILLGDIEGSEVQSILPRMLLGLDGVMMTARATSPEQLLYRLETLLLTSTSISSRHAASHQIGAAFDVVIQLNQFACGSRKVTSICELASDEEGTLFLNELFSFQKEGNDADGRIKGAFVATGAQPQFYQELDRLGVQLNTDLFATT